MAAPVEDAIVEDAADIQDAAPVPVAAMADERPERSERRDAIRAGNAERQRASYGSDQRNTRNQDRDRRHRRDDLGEAPIGFGDDIPAFMKVVAKV